MKEVPLVEWARRLLDDQLERLSELRNANPRDPGFKLWRQTTLTVIQRIWPGDLARCERFRRVPFSSTSPRATRAQLREHFERGCAEASAYLRILTLELETQGLAKTPPGAPEPKPTPLPEDLVRRPSGAPEPAYDPRDMFEPSPLDRIQASSTDQPQASGPTPPIAPAAAGAAPVPPPPMSIAPPDAPAAVTAPAAAPPAPVPPAPVPPAAPPAPKSRSRSASPESQAQVTHGRPPRRVGRPQLKEMLGFVDEPKASGAATPTPRPAAPAPASPGSPAVPPRAEAPPARVPPAAPPPAREMTPPIEPRSAEPAAPEEEASFDPPIPAPAFAAADDEPEVEPDLEAMMSQAEDEALGRHEPTRDGSATHDGSSGPGDLAIEFLNRSARASQAPTPAPVTTPRASAGTPAPPREVRAPAPPPPVEASIPAMTRPAPAPPPVVSAVTQPARPEPMTDLPASALVPIPLEAEPGASSPTAAALVALAAQVDRLGVPEGQRAAARAALVDLARQLDEEIASFDSIREILWVVADYPALARRAIPLLIPFLDLE